MRANFLTAAKLLLNISQLITKVTLILILVSSATRLNSDANVVTFSLHDKRLEYLRNLFDDRRSDQDIEHEPGGCTRFTLIDSKGISPGDFTRNSSANDSDSRSRGSSSNSSDGGSLANVDVLIHVLRGFEDQELTHIDETVDPLRDFHTVHREIMAKVNKPTQSTPTRY